LDTKQKYKEEIHYRTCHLCEAMCGLEVSTRGGEVTRIRGDEADVHSRGHICPKAIALQDIHTDPDRLRHPVKKTGDGWQRISWAEAFDLAEERILAIQREHGRDAVAIYTGNPTVHNTGTILYLYDFSHSLGTRNRFASHSLDQLPQMVVNGELFGHQAMFPVPDLDRTDCFLVFGANPLVSNGSIMSTPDVRGRLKAMQERGGRLIVVDPRRTRTARMADWHLFIRPGTDVLLLLALLHVLFEEQLTRRNHVWQFTDGLAELEALAQPYAPERVSPATGIAATDIRRLARQFAKAPRAAAYGRLGVSTQEYGGLCQWLIYTLNLLTGNLDAEGGLLFPLPAVDFLKLMKHEAKAFRWHSRVRGFPEVAGEFPTATLADEILEPGEGQVRGLVTIAGNPVLSAPNGDKFDRALGRLDFMLAIDLYINETTRHADLILPPAAGLEVMHYDFALYIVASRNSANFSGPVFSLQPGMKYDWQILSELQRRFERAHQGPWVNLKHALQRWLTPERRIDLGLRLGPYGVWGGRFGRADGLSLKKLRAHPHGIDLGPLRPSLPGRLFTPGKRIRLAPDRLLRELPKADRLLAGGTAQDSLLLIGRRHLQSNNSWMHNYARLMKQPDRCALLLHPQDAEARGIRDGESVHIGSKSGSLTVKAEITEDIMPGVVSIPHGWGHQLEGTQLALANRHPGWNVNRLTDDHVVDGLSGNAVFNGVPVWVSAVEEAGEEEEQSGNHQTQKH